MLLLFRHALANSMSYTLNMVKQEIFNTFIQEAVDQLDHLEADIQDLMQSWSRK